MYNSDEFDKLDRQIGCAFILVGIGVLAFWAAVAYIILHFLLKVW